MKSVLDQLANVPGVLAELPPATTGCGDGDRTADVVPEYVRRAAAVEGSAPVLVDSAAAENADDERVEEDAVPLSSPVFQFDPNVSADEVIATIAHRVDGHYRALTLLRGVDALGYYLSFHQLTYQWGIYLPLTGLAWMAVMVLGPLETSTERKLAIAAELVLAHERFHHAVDCAVAQMELLERQPLFWPLKLAAQEFRQPLIELEEECANAAMLRTCRHRGKRFPERGLAPLLTAFIKRQPTGYDRAVPTAASRHKLESRLLDHLQKSWHLAYGTEPPYGVEFQHLAPHDRPGDLARCPVMAIDDRYLHDLGSVGVRFISAIIDIQEGAEFMRELHRLRHQGLRAWEQAKRKLAHSTTLPGLDFKPWPPGGTGCFSVRLTRELRAHLRHTSDGVWIAEAVGRHAEMGHG